MQPPRIDLRSDTVTKPTDAMRAAMAGAEVGDDGYGEDPTVRALEERFAERLGKQAALFVPSGVMANQIALRLHTSPGDLVAAGARQHIVAYELGAAGRNAGVQFEAIDDGAGSLDLAAVAAVLEGPEHHRPPLSALFIESTHMASGGLFWTMDELERLSALTGPLPVHLDGARLFNAEVASGVSVDVHARRATTVMCCLSKGLCAPVGSLLAGTYEHIEEALLERKRLGGAMRQAGVLAACGLIALDSMVERLADDHERARRVAHAVSERWPEQAELLGHQQTNLVVFHHEAPRKLLEHLSASGIGAGTIAPGVVRLVCHAGIDDRAVAEVQAALSSAP
jgi:threonine aldolase